MRIWSATVTMQLLFSACTSLTPPPNISELLDRYEPVAVTYREHHDIDSSESKKEPAQVAIVDLSVEPSDDLYEQYQYSSSKEFLFETTDTFVRPQSGDLVDTLGRWRKQFKSSLNQNLDLGSRVRLSISPRRLHQLKLDEWKITIKELLKHPIKIFVSSDELSLSYTCPWPDA